MCVIFYALSDVKKYKRQGSSGKDSNKNNKAFMHTLLGEISPFDWSHVNLSIMRVFTGALWYVLEFYTRFLRQILLIMCKGSGVGGWTFDLRFLQRIIK